MEQLIDIFYADTWLDAFLTCLDLAIVYYVIYRVLLLIKGTKAVQMVFGLIFIIAFFVLSQEQYLNLSATHWFIERFITNFIIIVVIIFQDDIRRALAQFGRTSVFSSMTSIEETQVLEEVIKASVMLSSRKIGALIAIEREADLTHFTEEGIRIDGDVTKDLLFSLFVPEHQNPLHDGAAIIQQGKVSAAGCVLPLTTNPEIEKTLGTRHRAGIGLSEDTDAAVVIVSEESGMISIAHNGGLEKDLDANEMRDLLQKIFTSRGFELEENEKLLDQFHAYRENEETSSSETND